MTLRGVIFDLDGTVVDSRLDFPAIRREMRLPVGASILEALADIPAGPQREECLRILERHERAGADRATVIPGVRALLDALAARNILRAVLTRNSRPCVDHVLSRLDLSFSCVITREDAPPKPDPAGLLQICATWQVLPAEVILIGDFLHDIHCGQNAGVRTILYAPRGVPDYGSLADHCVTDFAQAERLIDGM